jgi:hypothetical protein
MDESGHLVRSAPDLGMGEKQKQLSTLKQKSWLLRPNWQDNFMD